MVAQDIRDVTKRFAEAFNRGDLDAAVEFYTDATGKPILSLFLKNFHRQ